MATVFATVSTPGPAGPTGAPGYTPQFIVAAGAPSNAAGNNADMYIDSSTGNVYGPKTAGAWGPVVCNIKGSTGAAGATGAAGYSPIYHVAAGPPTGAVGINGDMYIDSSTSDVYGPKSSGAWGSVQCNIKGSTGPQGAPGVAYTPRGAWAAGTTYAQGDEVTNASLLYISLQAANVGNTPASSPTWWQTVGSGVSQTPWLSNIDGAGKTLSGVGLLGIGSVAPGHPIHILTTAATANAANATIFIQRNVGTSFAGIAWNAASVANPIIYSPISGDSICFGMDNGVSISEKVRITPGGSVGIGTSNPTNQFVISAGGASGFEINPNYTSGVATGTYIVAYDRNAGQYRDIIIDQNGAFVSSFRTNGCVGIGTLNPLAPLQVHVGVNLNLGVRVSAGKTAVAALNDANSAVVALRLESSEFTLIGGAVGVGVTPTQTFHVLGNIYAQAGNVIIDAGAGLHAGSLDFGNYGARGNDANIGAYSGNLLLQYGGAGFTGRVGIGVASPNEKLSMAGGSLMIDAFGDAGSSQYQAYHGIYFRDGFGSLNPTELYRRNVSITTGQGTGGLGDALDINAAHHISLFAGGVEAMRVQGTGGTQGYIGMGTPTPSDTLSIVCVAWNANVNGGIRLQSAGNEFNVRWALKSDGTGQNRGAIDVQGIEMVSVTSSGVGINGVVHPGYQLHVSGDVNCTGAFRVNGVAIGAGGSGVALYGWCTSATAVTNAAYTDIPGCSLTLAQAGRWLITASFDANINGSDGTAVLQGVLNVNGTVQTQVCNFRVNSGNVMIANIFQQWVQVVGAGIVVKLQAWRAGGTATVTTVGVQTTISAVWIAAS